MKLNDIPVSRRLWGTIFALMLAMSAIAGGALYSTTSAYQSAIDEGARYSQNILLAAKWRGLTDVQVQRLVAMAVSTDPAINEAFSKRFAEDVATITKYQKDAAAGASTQVEQTALAEVNDKRLLVSAASGKILEMRKSGAEKPQIEAVIRGELMPSIEAYLKELSEFVELQENRRDTAMIQSAEHRNHVLWAGVAAAVGVFLAAIAWAHLMIRSIRQPLGETVAVADAIAGGDLTVSISAERQDEFGQLLRAMSQMAQRLRSVVSEVRQGVESVSSASGQIAVGNQDLSSRTEMAASNLQQTASSLEQITAGVGQTADAAAKARELADSAVTAAVRGGAAVDQVVASMRDISESSTRIAEIIGVIDGIAFQTNILSLNAAVEAARAGEQGRGFAVVASEVRQLAQRSAQAAKEIKALIGTAVDRVEAGSGQVSGAGAVMKEIVSRIQGVTTLISEIATGASEQRDGISQVNQAVVQLDAITQQNAALVEESAAAAASLNDQALRLATSAAAFNVGH